METEKGDEYFIGVSFGTKPKGIDSQDNSKTKTNPAGVVFGFITLVSCVYVLWTKSFSETFKFSSYVGLPLTSLMLIAGLIAVRSKSDEKATEGVGFYIGFSFLVLLFSPLFGFFYYSIFAVIKDIVVHLNELQLKQWISNKRLYAIIGVCLILSAGTILFYFRLRFRALYGLSESIVGVVIGVNRFEVDYQDAVSISPGFYLAFLTASIYLVVRVGAD